MKEWIFWIYNWLYLVKSSAKFLKQLGQQIALVLAKLPMILFLFEKRLRKQAEAIWNGHSDRLLIQSYKGSSLGGIS